jgi:hypothetical protein
MAQIRWRGTAKFFLWPRHWMGVGGQRHAPSALPSTKARNSLYRRMGGPQARSGRVRKISPSTGFDPRTVQPIARRYIDWAIPDYIIRLFFSIFNPLIFLISLIPFVELSPCLHIPSKRTLKQVFTLEMAHNTTQLCNPHVSTCIYVFICKQNRNVIVYMPTQLITRWGLRSSGVLCSDRYL